MKKLLLVAGTILLGISSACQAEYFKLALKTTNTKTFTNATPGELETVINNWKL